MRARITVLALPNVTNKVVKEIEWFRSNHYKEPISPEHVLFDIALKLRQKASEKT